MKNPLSPFLLVLFVVAAGCSASGPSYSPSKKFGKDELVQDFNTMRKVLETKHPSLYWYTSKDSMDMYFNLYESLIADSMTELQFAWLVMAPTVDKINCGHTSISMSRPFVRAVKNVKLPSFPLYLKVWGDTMAVTGSLIKKDSIFRRGTLISSINGVPNKYLISRMFGYLPQDGYANNINYTRLSTNFPYYHRNIFGISKNYTVTYIDSAHQQRTVNVPVFVPRPDSTKKEEKKKRREIKLTQDERMKSFRNMVIDSSGKFAVMELNTFSHGNLRAFFRRSFRMLDKKDVPNLIIDFRNNGGGRLGLSTLLTKYLSRTPFRIADTLFSVSNTLGKYTGYAKRGFLNNIQLRFTTRKMQDGYYHMRYYEKKRYKPKQDNHFNRRVYIITNGPTFSASTIVCNILKGQKDITLVGEETGGGWYGNNGILIPDITLPNTGLRFRLPLFRLVQYNHIPQKGPGVMPDVYIGPSYDALLKKYDAKMVWILEEINKK